MRCGSILLVALCLVACGDAGVDSPEAAGRLAIKAMRSNKFELCEPMLFTESDIEWLVEKMRAGKSRKAKKIVARFEQVGAAAMAKEVRDHVRRTFDRVRKKVARVADWSQITFDRLHKLEEETVDGVTAAGFHIRLRIGDKPGEISVDSMFHTPRGWVLGDGFED